MTEPTREQNTNEGQGMRVDAFIASAPERNLLRVRKGNLEKLSEIRHVIVVGSSGSGKTTFVNQMREALAAHPELAERFDIPKRVLTRPQRENDDLGENMFAANDAEFEEQTAGGLTWKRDMGDGRVERYGFVKAAGGRIPVYSGNNALIKNRDSIVSDDAEFLAHALVIMVYAEDEARQDRFGARSKDIVATKEGETKMRMGDRAISMYPDAHILVRNSEATTEDLGSAANLVLRAVEGSFKENV